MGETIYNFVSSFPKVQSEFNSIIKAVESGGQLYCKEINTYFPQNWERFGQTCKEVYSYLNDLEGKYLNVNDVKERCKYLSYWLYEKIENNDELTYNTLSLYQNFMQMNEHFPILEKNICNNYIEVISEDTYNELKELYGLFDELNNLQKNSHPQILQICENATKCYTKYMSYKDTCHGNKKKNLRNELERFRREYNSFIQNKASCNPQIKTLPSFQETNVDVLIIPIVIVLFTPLGSWFYGRIKRKKNMRKFMNEEKEQFSYDSKIPNINSHKTQYNIAYYKS
ncbi:PIR protein [Plasmodium vivax]|uniref:VIR protein n=1 Tax=Plasmodium vivax TaxID=5855 RepID=A0A564ZUA6_PLAVI|nr:PIR protein [Plasmodium vivax]